MTTYSVPEISCDHCKQSIEDAVGAVPGVSAVVVHVDARTVDVELGSASESAVIEAIEEAGYDVAGTTSS